MWNQSKEQDIQDLLFLRQQVIQAEQNLLFSYITYKQYQHILSRVIARLEILECKYGTIE